MKTRRNPQEFRVVRIDNGRDNPSTGTVRSRLRSLEEAKAFIADRNRILQRKAGYANSSHPYAVEQAVTVEYTDGDDREGMGTQMMCFGWRPATSCTGAKQSVPPTPCPSVNWFYLLLGIAVIAGASEKK